VSDEQDKPNPHDPALVGREDVFKYLGIHGYDKWQVDKNGLHRDGSSEWIKDYCRKESDADYCRLTFYQRYVLDALRRLRGLNGKNPSNNVLSLCRQLSANGPDRPHVRSAISLLLTRKLLLLTNEPLHFQEVVEVIEKNRKEKSTGTSLHSSSYPEATATPTAAPTSTPNPTPAPGPFVLATYDKPLGGFSAEQVATALAYMHEKSSEFWLPKLGSEKKLAKHIATLINQAGNWQPATRPVGRTWDKSCAACGGTGYENRSGLECLCNKYFRTDELKEEIGCEEWHELLLSHMSST
jgi:hypothetical protein